MKATELMNGDYITVTPSGMLIKVAAVHKRKVAYHACTNKLSWVREGLLRPIPITPEILEKNGFKNNGKDKDMYYWNWSICDDCISYDNGTGKIRIFHSLGNLVFVLPLRYVHELQHALKLCKIEKEIIL